MIGDLQEVDDDPFRGRLFDVCICGAGVAGITLALKLSPRLNVLLLEGGGYEYSQDSQAIYTGTNEGREYFDLAATRLRYFGGTSNHWAGWCRPLDRVDFRAKHYVDISGWPIDRKSLDPFMEEAQSILDIQSPNNRTTEWDAVTAAVGESGDFENIEFYWSRPPTKFGMKYRDQITQMRNVTCFVNANVTDIRLTDNLAAVQEVEVADYRNRIFYVRTRCLVLATGGIENPRILLNCDSQMAGGIGNSSDLVGRFFTEHPHNTAGEFILEDDARAKLAEGWKNPFEAFRYYSPAASFMSDQRILNGGVRLQPYEISAGDFEERLKRVICRSELAQDTVERLFDTEISCLHGRRVEGKLHIASEQALNPESRVRLGTDRDRFGMRRAILDWKLSEIDKRTIRVLAFRFGEIFAAANVGRLRIADWLLTSDDDLNFPGPGEDEVAGNHHMCTTRMADAPAAGVVDRNQKVFGVDNLYIAGSSVFSTGGHANPTLTIVQTTLRLAGHLNESLAEPT